MLFFLLAVPAMAQQPPIPPTPPGFDPAKVCDDLLKKIEAVELGILITQGRITTLTADLAAADDRASDAYDAWVAALESGDVKKIAAAADAFTKAQNALIAITIALLNERTLLAKLKADLIMLQQERARLGC